MTKIEALELELKARKIVDWTALGWVEVIRLKDDKRPACNMLELFNLDHIEFALGIIEGKPVWEGDEVFCPIADAFVMQNGKRKLIADSTLDYGRIMMQDGGIFSVKHLSWNPPKLKNVKTEKLQELKTVLVELPIDAVKNWSEYYHGATEVLAVACRKALKGVK